MHELLLLGHQLGKIETVRAFAVISLSLPRHLGAGSLVKLGRPLRSTKYDLKCDELAMIRWTHSVSSTQSSFEDIDVVPLL